MSRNLIGQCLGLILLGQLAMAQRSAPQPRVMAIGHLHLGVKDIPAALRWFEQVLQWKVAYRDDRIAVLASKPIGIILDHAASDAVVTISFESKDVDGDYRQLLARGANSLKAPIDKPYGVRGAYLRGPGALTIELEGPLLEKKP